MQLGFSAPSSFHALDVDRVPPSLAPRISSTVFPAADANAIQSRRIKTLPEDSRILQNLS